MSRFKEVRVLARICSCTDSCEPLLLKRKYFVTENCYISIFLVLDYMSVPISIPFKRSEGASENVPMR